MTTQIQKPLTLKRWVLYTTYGWFLGILLVVGFAIISEMIFKLKDESGGQAVVGIGMGAGVGLMQGVVLRKYLESFQKWLWFSIIGFTISFVLFDIMAATIDLNIKVEFALPFATTLGALISGSLQYIILRNISSKASHWIAYNTIAWMLAHLITSGMFLINLNKSWNMPKAIIAVVALFFLTVGGPILGSITGRFIIPAVNKQPPIEQ